MLRSTPKSRAFLSAERIWKSVHTRVVDDGYMPVLMYAFPDGASTYASGVYCGAACATAQSAMADKMTMVFLMFSPCFGEGP